MPETTGKRLAKARLAKGLTIDEAAHATRLRPDKVLALENDDYSRFPNNAYAKGFLQIYSKFLSIDVSDFARTLETVNPVVASDYQYLNNSPQPEPERYRIKPESRRPSIAPLVVFVVISTVAVYGFYFWLNMQRLQHADTQSQQQPQSQEKAPEVTAGTEKATAPEVRRAEPNRPVPAATPGQGPRAVSPGSTAVVTNSPGAVPTAPAPAVGAPAAPAKPQPVAQNPAPGVPVITPSSIDGIQVRPAQPVSDRDFITAAAPGSNGLNEISLQPLKKTWVKIRKDDPKSAPIFEDYLYPNAPALKLRGARFFVEVRDESAVSIRKNGAPIAYQPPGITIQ